MTTLRDEAAMRRPEFTEGHKLILGDGQEWSFPRVVLRWHPARDPSGGFMVRKSDPYGPEFQGKLAELMDLEGDDEESQNRRHTLRMLLAAELLCRNYDLSDADLEALLPLEAGEENAAMWLAIYYVLMGVGAPKR